MDETTPYCAVCGGSEFAERPILWPALIAAWELSPDEVTYIDAQQGTSCIACGANLRSIALARAILIHLGSSGPLAECATSEGTKAASILEINEAGSLHGVLRRFPGHVYAVYPAVDMHALPYASDSFDLVVHSDTLEHLEQPVRALSECRRVLKRDGALCFTVPIVIGRMSRSRSGLPDSFHGTEQERAEDFKVHTEFGADAWTYVLEAGFDRVELVTVQYPAAIALIARRDRGD